MRLTALFLAVLVSSAFAHPGHDLSEELAERKRFSKATRSSNLAYCADKIKAQGLAKRNAIRRSIAVKDSIKKREYRTQVKYNVTGELT